MERLLKIFGFLSTDGMRAAVIISLGVHAGVLAAVVLDPFDGPAPEHTPMIVEVQVVAKSPRPGGDIAPVSGKQETADPSRSIATPVSPPERESKQPETQKRRPLPVAENGLEKPVAQDKKDKTEKEEKPAQPSPPQLALRTQPSAPGGDTGAPGQGKESGLTYQAGHVANPKPPYPRLARRRGWQGQVTLSIDVNVDGRPAAVKIDQSSGHDILDEAAAETIRERWRLPIAQKDGAAVPYTTARKITFRLE